MAVGGAVVFGVGLEVCDDERSVGIAIEQVDRAAPGGFGLAEQQWDLASDDVERSQSLAERGGGAGIENGRGFRCGAAAGFHVDAGKPRVNDSPHLARERGIEGAGNVGRVVLVGQAGGA